MGLPVLIMGKSGSGKSRSFKNFEEKELGVISVIPKALPFRNKRKMFVSTDYNTIQAVLLKSKTPSIAIDDAGYLLTDEFIRRGRETGYNKFNDLASNFYNLINFITHQLPPEKIVYLVMHEDQDEMSGYCKPKTIGKMLDEKVCVEGLFTIVLRCINDNGEHKFITNGDGAKTPEEMFDDTEIENDLKVVDSKIREYYNLYQIEEKEGK